MPAQRFQNRAGGKPLMHKKRQRRHVERELLGFASPIKKGFRKPGKLARGVSGGFERRCFQNFTKQRFALLTRGILAIPIERRRKGRIVRVARWLLALAKLCLRADVRPLRGCLAWMLIRLRCRVRVWQVTIVRTAGTLGFWTFGLRSHGY